MCYLMHVKKTSALIEKRRGLPWCFWSDRQQIGQQHLVNHYMVLSELGLIIQTKSHILQEILFVTAPGNVCYKRSHNYYYNYYRAHFSSERNSQSALQAIHKNKKTSVIYKLS